MPAESRAGGCDACGDLVARVGGELECDGSLAERPQRVAVLLGQGGLDLALLQDDRPLLRGQVAQAFRIHVVRARATGEVQDVHHQGGRPRRVDRAHEERVVVQRPRPRDAELAMDLLDVRLFDLRDHDARIRRALGREVARACVDQLQLERFHEIRAAQEAEQQRDREADGRPQAGAREAGVRLQSRGRGHGGGRYRLSAAAKRVCCGAIISAGGL